MSPLWMRRKVALSTAFLTFFVVAGSMSLSKYSLKQSINIPGIKKAMQAIFEPSLMIPQIYVRKINELDFQSMRDNGIRCVVFDKDNTLSHTYVDELHPSVISKMDEVRTIFPKKRHHALSTEASQRVAVAILSNSVGSCDDPDYKGAAKTEKMMKLPVIRHTAKKPSCIKEVVDHFELVLKRPVSPTEICMIGDRVLTDVVFGNQYGMLSVLVEPLSLVKDHPVAVIIRFLETKLLLPVLRMFGFKARQKYVQANKAKKHEE